MKKMATGAREVLVALPVLALASTALAQADHSAVIVNGTVRAGRLEIRAERPVKAAPGHDVTLTVDGVGMPLRPGIYSGDVVLTATRENVVPYRNGGPYRYRAGIFVDPLYSPERSVGAIVRGGPVTANTAKNVTIVSREEKFNGIIARGKANYTVNGASIDLTGNGGNDFVGFGAAIMATDDARLTVNRARIRTKGAIRTAVFIGGTSTVVMNDCDIRTENGTLPAGYTFSIAPGSMMEVPYGMGMTGNVRATNLIDNGTVYYNRCHVVSQGWGVLSSDGDGPTHMYVKDTHVETVESGYGAYANGEAHDHFDHVRFDVHDYGLIVGGPGSATFTNGTVVNSKRAGIMAHQGSGGGVIRIEGGSVFNTASTAIQIKGRGTTIVIDAASVKPANGIILQTMDNDDPIMAGMRAGGPGGPPPPGGAGMMPGASAPKMSPDVVVTVRRATLGGNIYHAMKSGALRLNIEEGGAVAGIISSAGARPASGQAPTRETFRSVGYVNNTPAAVTGDRGAFVAVMSGGSWAVAGRSYLAGLRLAPGGRIAASRGKLVLRVDGVARPLRPGSYSGQIELSGE